MMVESAAPLSASDVIAQCRRSWNRKPGSPAFFVSVRQADRQRFCGQSVPSNDRVVDEHGPQGERQKRNWRAHGYLAEKLAIRDHGPVERNRFAKEQATVKSRFVDFHNITPYPYEAQAVSGTLAYALGAGKAIISTPYWHAAELLAGGRGVLVPFEDSDAIAAAAIKLLDNELARKAISRVPTYMPARWFGTRPQSLT